MYSAGLKDHNSDKAKRITAIKATRIVGKVAKTIARRIIQNSKN